MKKLTLNISGKNRRPLLLLVFVLLNLAAQGQGKIKWPKHKRAVIVLTYDDALLSQLNTAVPQLKKAHLPATFFLTGDINSETIGRWRKLGKQGYELANHTLFHPCLSTDDNPVASEKYTPYSMIREIEVTNHFLYAVDGKVLRTYAYPCTETIVGGQDYVDTLRKYKLIKYARIGGDETSVVTDFKHLDSLRVPSYGLEDSTSSEKLIAFVKLAEKTGGMGVIMFHGISGDYITTSAKAHQELVDYLRKNRKDLWITTFQKAMDYATQAVKESNYIAEK